MDVRKQRALVAASVAGLVSAAGLLGLGRATQAADTGGEESHMPCYGINKCKGVGACGGAGHSCAGMNACKGQGYLEVEKDTCLKIEGGRLTAEVKS